MKPYGLTLAIWCVAAFLHCNFRTNEVWYQQQHAESVVVGWPFEFIHVEFYAGRMEEAAFSATSFLIDMCFAVIVVFGIRFGVDNTSATQSIRGWMCFASVAAIGLGTYCCDWLHSRAMISVFPILFPIWCMFFASGVLGVGQWFLAFFERTRESKGTGVECCESAADD
ncbi:hypothetical protein Enr13x_49340 [Stieleria neptunia]|uniref:Uncharacterized protein n=1 Tax=Stieleria neptunia TaxID=2527979 RepID=A0A518HW36_9BACT|nr:hypothetical protein [Stieleria neptunia]QDV45061.1 hypothetical protein Enr13x_49340 [Stieleria neptunia]